MTHELDAFIAKIEHLAARIDKSKRKALMRDIAQEIRQRNARRIKANIEPDGNAMPKRHSGGWRKLKNGQTLKVGQTFNYLKQKETSLAWLQDDGHKIIGRETGEKKQASGFLRQNIYFKSHAKQRLHMFKKIGNAKYLRQKYHADAAQISFLGGLTAKIAAEHHYGNSRKNLPARELLGLSADDLQFVQNRIIQAISETI